MNTQLVLLLILVCFMFILYLSPNDSPKYIYITIENQKFKVTKYRNYKISYEIATRLHKLKKKIDFLIKNLHNPEKIDSINRLKNKYKGVLEDSNILKKTGYVGYSINKGSTIGICVYKNNKFENENEMMFVVLHELAHCMTLSYNHTKEFWNNFRFLLKEATRLNIYNNIDYYKNSKNYCNIILYHNPLF